MKKHLIAMAKAAVCTITGPIILIAIAAIQ